MNRRHVPPGTTADICLLLEGTFPYVTGGVSAWVHQLIESFPHYRFAVVFIGGRQSDYGEPVYALPHNVIHLEEHFIQEGESTAVNSRCPQNAHAFLQVDRLHQAFRNCDALSMGELMREVLPNMDAGECLSLAAFMHGKASWDLIVQHYKKHCSDPSFTDYFWTIRLMHQPIWQLVDISKNLVPARVYHTVSTGYAGLLGALAHYRGKGRLLVSEHGIYTKERKIDLLQSGWVRDNRSLLERDGAQMGYLRELWVRFFQSLGRITYEAADNIVSLFEGNRQRQIREGAEPSKTLVIPNGISLERFRVLRQSQPPMSPPAVVALIGRVVPIKDVKTFIRAVMLARLRLPGLVGWIIGPDDEDPDYADECRALVQSLGLEERVQFLGRRRIDDFLPQIGLITLSSISEGLPLALLEGFASGVPAVATDVGSCRLLIEGGTVDDQALGRAGEVVPIANPQKLSDAMVALLSNPARWQAARAAGMGRVERFYSDSTMTSRYADLYESLFQKADEEVEVQ